jgi:hypothetical protein
MTSKVTETFITMYIQPPALQAGGGLSLVFSPFRIATIMPIEAPKHSPKNVNIAYVVTSLIKSCFVETASLLWTMIKATVQPTIRLSTLVNRVRRQPDRGESLAIGDVDIVYAHPSPA